MIIIGKLSDLWAQLKTAPPDKVIELQQEINKVEQWCIDKGFANINEITDWSKKSNKKTYRFETDRMYGYNPPESARFGNDRCNACKYNKHPYCDPKDLYGHFANI